MRTNTRCPQYPSTACSSKIVALACVDYHGVITVIWLDGYPVWGTRISNWFLWRTSQKVKCVSFTGVWLARATHETCEKGKLVSNSHCIMHQKPCFRPFVSVIGISNWFKYQISKPTSRGLLAKGETCLYSFPTYLQRTVGQGWNVFIQFPNLPPEDCLPGCNLYIRSPNLPPGDCLLGLQPVSQPT